jgi:hypothetical protein
MQMKPFGESSVFEEMLRRIAMTVSPMLMLFKAIIISKGFFC